MKHSTSLTPHATLSVHEHLEELLHTGLQAVLKTNLAEPRAGAGRPRELPSLSLWLAVVVGILRGVRSFRMHHNPEDSFYTVNFKVMGVDFQRLNVEDPLCRPLAVIVGDDDGFVDVSVTSPSFTSPRVSLPRTCIDPSAGWPWLGR